MKNKHYLVYQITNLINEKIYVGIHITENINDGYLGSGVYLKRAIKKYGIENFKKEILFDFDNPEEMVAKEIELVDRKFIARKDTYNINCGGNGWNTFDTIPVMDRHGNQFRVHKTDERWLSGELKHNMAGRVVVRDCIGSTFSVEVDDPKYLSGELVSVAKNKTVVRDIQGNVFCVDKEDVRLETGQLLKIDRFYTNGTVNAIDSSGHKLRVSVDDPRLCNGDLQYTWTNRKHKENTKQKIGAANSIYQAGEKNSQYGTCWITNEFENKKIKKSELESYLEKGWKKGRKMKT